MGSGAPLKQCGKGEPTRAVVEFAKDWYQNRIKQNNGIKEDNLKKLVLPLGVDWTGIHPGWVADMNSFGSSRGDVAHQTVGVQKAINPQDDYNLVNGSLLPGLAQLDAILAAKSKSPS